VLVEISNYDLLNKTGYLSQLELEAKSLASEILQVGINNDNLNQTRQNLVSNPPYLDLSSELFALIPESRLRSSVAELIAENLIVNQKLEQELWDEQKQKVADSIDPVIVKFFEEDIVVSEGEKINSVQYNALDNFGYLSGESRSIQTAAIPIIGDFMVELLRGGESVGQSTLTRFYSLHTFVFPWSLAVFMLMHFLMIRKQGISGPL